MIFYKTKSGKYNNKLIQKKDNKYYIGQLFNCNKVYSGFYKALAINIFQYKNSSDYYVIIYGENNDSSIITDNYKSEFYNIPHDESYDNFIYMGAYVQGEIINNYKLIINDNEIKILWICLSG